jgi:hypothetical protein
MGMRTIEAPEGSYRFQVPETFGQVVSINSPGDLDILPSDALLAWMQEKNIKCTLIATWETNDLHFNLAAEIQFENDDDAILFKLTWQLE